MTDDKEYSDLMDSYKKLRRDPKKFKEANDTLDKALALKKKGKVSTATTLGWQYL
jgi:hypothetical protein